jgi:oligopeptide/dipeptide ABC transporter ATP-binding protein
VGSAVSAGAQGAPLLSVRDLVTVFNTPEGTVRAVSGVSYDVFPGEIVGVVGESGSGKSVNAMSIVGLVDRRAGRVLSGEVTFDGQDLLKASPKRLRHIRGSDIGFIFQDPMTSLNPVLKVGTQLVEAIRLHDRHVSRGAARARALELLELVGIPNAAARLGQYPFQFSGGMVQRVMIAMAIANRPRLLIADEPTTALDTTIQAQILDVLRAAQRETRAATILITHDLGLVAEMCDRVIVMYAGRIVETGDVRAIFHSPRHPYTVGLMASLPRMDVEIERLVPLGGQPPSLIKPPSGCAFHPRCALRRDRAQCVESVPPLQWLSSSQASACHFAEEVPSLLAQVAATTGLELGDSRPSDGATRGPGS